MTYTRSKRSLAASDQSQLSPCNRTQTLVYHVTVGTFADPCHPRNAMPSHYVETMLQPQLHAGVQSRSSLGPLRLASRAIYTFPLIPARGAKHNDKTCATVSGSHPSALPDAGGSGNEIKFIP